MGKVKKGAKLEELQGKIAESAQKVWLAGLGALAVAEEEGGRLFKDLVRRGESVESKLKGEVESLRKDIGVLAERARGQAGRVLDRMESGWDEKVGQTLSRLGVPTREEIASLTARVEELTRKLEERMAEGKKSRSRTESGSSTDVG